MIDYRMRNRLRERDSRYKQYSYKTHQAHDHSKECSRRGCVSQGKETSALTLPLSFPRDERASRRGWSSWYRPGMEFECNLFLAVLGTWGSVESAVSSSSGPESLWKQVSTA